MHPNGHATNGAAEALSHSKAILDPCAGVAPCMPTTAFHEARLKVLGEVSSPALFYFNCAATTLSQTPGC